MALYLGDKKISKLYLGDTECKKAYLGDTLVLDNSAPQKFQWQEFAMLPVGNWSSICYGDKFVAIQGGNKNIVSFSQDGKTWSRATLPVSGYWDRIAYGGGLYVAIAGAYNHGASVYSADGINYTSVPLGKSYWNDVAYGDGKFVAVRGQDTTFYSSNAYAIVESNNTIKQWSYMNMPYSAEWTCISYGNGKFVAGCSGAYIAYSSDGINWSLQSTGDIQNIFRICYGNGIFVGLSSNGILYSSDGITWTQSNIGSDYDSFVLSSVAYGNNKFVVVSGAYQNGTSYYNDLCFTSNDGKTWEQSTLPSKQVWSDVAFGGNIFCAVAESKNSASVGAYSVDS